MLTKYSNQINNINIYYVLHLRYMLTFNNLIYRLINHSNKNVKLLTNEFINNKEFNLDIIDLNPDTSLLSIICHCFIYKYT